MNLLRLFVLSVFLSAVPTQAQVFSCIADHNTPVPGGLPGETFSTFDEEDPPLVSDRCVVFRGQGNIAAQVGGIERFEEFEEAFALDDCDVVFDGTGDDSTLGIYLKREGMPLEVVADNNTQAPGGTFFDFEDPWLEDEVVVFVATISGGGCGGNAIYKTDGAGGFAVVADSCGGTLVPAGLAGETFEEFDTRPVLLDGVLTFRGLGDGDPPTRGIYAEVGRGTPAGGRHPGSDSWRKWRGLQPVLSNLANFQRRHGVCRGGT